MAWHQAIIWTNADLIHWRIYAALGGDELNDKAHDKDLGTTSQSGYELLIKILQKFSRLFLWFWWCYAFAHLTKLLWLSYHDVQTCDLIGPIVFQ